MNSFEGKFSEAYQKLFALHPQQDEDVFALRYLHVKWFFPNHLHNVLKNIVALRKRFYPKADVSVALYGGLFHDAGLVYKRESASPSGHENRSVEFAAITLKELGYDDTFIGLVSECIKATEPEYDSPIPEAVLVKNADAYSHLISMHFFAKANFAKDIYSYIPWFAKKIETSYKKLTILELKEEIAPLYGVYRNMVQNYAINESEKGDIIKIIISQL
jgi:hypothetical protein